MSKKQVTSGTKAKKTIVNIIIHIFLAILSFIWVLPIFWVVQAGSQHGSAPSEYPAGSYHRGPSG